jgi:hypothetical protein
LRTRRHPDRGAATAPAGCYCLPHARADRITVLTIQACLPAWRMRVEPFCPERLDVALTLSDILVLPGMSGWQAGRVRRGVVAPVAGIRVRESAALRVSGPDAGRRRVPGMWREVL